MKKTQDNLTINYDQNLVIVLIDSEMWKGWGLLRNGSACSVCWLFPRSPQPRFYILESGSWILGTREKVVWVMWCQKKDKVKICTLCSSTGTHRYFNHNYCNSLLDFWILNLLNYSIIYFWVENLSHSSLYALLLAQCLVHRRNLTHNFWRDKEWLKIGVLSLMN